MSVSFTGWRNREFLKSLSFSNCQMFLTQDGYKRGLHFHEFRVFTSQKCCLINITVVSAVQINIHSHFLAKCAIEKIRTIILIARKHRKYIVFVLAQITDLGQRKFPRLVLG